SLLKSVAEYDDLLATLSDEEFIVSPSDGGWSYSETYSHIFQSNLFSLHAVEKCIVGTGIYNRKTIHWLAWIILFAGRFPPVKIKAPAKIAAMVSKVSREDTRNLIVKFRMRLGDIKSKIKKADPHQKMKHPRLGLLNAKQWFRFIEVHTIHHTRQLKRIGRILENEEIRK
ncbi:MAG: DinB family protein, partial [Pedobacter sp.]